MFIELQLCAINSSQNISHPIHAISHYIFTQDWPMRSLGNVMCIRCFCLSGLYVFPLLCQHHLNFTLGSHSPQLHAMCFYETNPTCQLQGYSDEHDLLSCPLATGTDLEMGINTDRNRDRFGDISQANETKSWTFAEKHLGKSSSPPTGCKL